MAQIQWIGTGSGLNPTLGNTSFLLKESSNSLENSILIDCGSTVTPILHAKEYLPQIKNIVITHLHADHIGGLELLGFMHYFAFQNKSDDRPTLYFATEQMANNLWEKSLKGGMEYVGWNIPDVCGIEEYFNVHVGEKVSINNLPTITFQSTPHAPGMENYGLYIGDDVYYSGDTTKMPPFDTNLIFQDCQFWKGSIHISLDELKEMPQYVKENTHLVHLGGNYKDIDPKKYGFPKFVIPGDVFEI